jgi:hypothetical protein
MVFTAPVYGAEGSSRQVQTTEAVEAAWQRSYVLVWINPENVTAAELD